jgi:ribonuclease HI
MKRVSLITDGSCLGNLGRGGWACLLRFGGEKEQEIFGFDPDTTNQRMELMAAIQGLLALEELAFKEPCEVEIITDSKYVSDGMTMWISTRKQRQWWRKHEHVPNAGLWIELDQLASLHKPTWEWTRGHAGHEDNARCDLLARNAATTQKSSWADGRPHAPLPLKLGADYVPPKPQPGLFDVAEPDAEDDEDDGEELQ